MLLDVDNVEHWYVLYIKFFFNSLKKLIFDYSPFIASYNIRVQVVLLLPGGPTIIIGILFNTEMRIINKFSFKV